MSVRIGPAEPPVVRELRRRVLRPHQRADELVYEHDDDPDALHLGAFRGDVPVAVASITREPPPGSADPDAWRLRGMATIEGERGRGIGGRLLRACLEHAVGRDGTLAWCNARASAVAFYERHGFSSVRGPFELPGIGPHHELRRPLR